MLHAYKYHQKTLYRQSFIRVMIDHVAYYRLDIRQFDLIAPIGLHPCRRRERGYNQSELIAAGLSQHFHVPMSPRLIIRSKPTPSQTGLPAKERWTNLKGAFKIHSSINIRTKKILMIDDLITTGATASRAADALKNAGVSTAALFTLGTTP